MYNADTHLTGQSRDGLPGKASTLDKPSFLEIATDNLKISSPSKKQNMTLDAYIATRLGINNEMSLLRSGAFRSYISIIQNHILHQTPNPYPKFLIHNNPNFIPKTVPQKLSYTLSQNTTRLFPTPSSALPSLSSSEACPSSPPPQLS